MTLKIGKISFWHVHAWDYTKEAQEHPGSEIVAVWDEDPKRGQEAADKLNVPFYASLDDLLASDIDAVIVDAPTRLHHEVMVKAARAGKHIFTEKVVAPTAKEAEDIVAEVNNSGVKLTVSLPRLNDGYTLAIREVLDQQLLGKITQVRARLSHNGALENWLPEHFYSLEDCLGGALIDLGCHPMYLTRLFLGEAPESLTAQYGYVTGRQVEDNAVAVLKTPSGAVGIVEAGFVNSHSPFTVEIQGTEGTLLYGTPDEKLLLRTNRKGEEYAKSWHELPIPANRESAYKQWISHIENGTTADENIFLAVELSKLMEAANNSNVEKRTISLA
ncbi:Gfo/Idh/MocA family protein [Paenibacillus sp. GCM10012307]|uniref:Gfo/Idh/MocA family oxidoreductase n=1 Tax=Paenibacillus roseus TaxID=2798579 RepID=A0A934J971_9BACL|nr:Gfo/Idh/MocA family oxidoreductase [Paenibacillus roseus]MBJ6362660.1 Gfo/Idh/MocA family oxidoreductase [Paenibacillus roseus]